MLANMVCSLIKHKRVTTTLAKAKAVRPVAEKMITLGKKGSIHHRRLAVARLHQEDAVRILFNEIAPQHEDRPGGYTRIIKTGRHRLGDGADLVVLQLVGEEEGSEASSDNVTGRRRQADRRDAFAASLGPVATAEVVEEAVTEEAPADEAPPAEEASGEAPKDDAEETSSE